jgi:plasmid stabilization system protein ParE
MKRRLIARPRAELDIIEHIVYLSERKPRIAARFRHAVKESFDAIRHAPRSGAALPLKSMPGVELRFVKPRTFKNYLVIYQVADDTVFVLRVLHGSQDLESALRP